jgi:NAD(P)H dehydrogenase (quinone)
MNRILVTSASGTIGRPLVQRLRALHADFRVMSSRPGADVQADFADPASLRRAFAGADTLFLLLPLVPHKLELARNAVAAAQAAGVKHIVRSSGAGADPASPNALAALQGEIDAVVAGSGIHYTFLRPMGFMQNWASFAAGQVKAGAYYAPHGQGAQSLVDARDIADAAAAVLVDPTPHAGRAYTLTGAQALTNDQQLALIGQAIGKTVAYVDVPEATAQAAMQDMGMPPVMVAWFMGLHMAVKNGWAGAVTDDVQTLTGHAPRRFADFVTEHKAAWS